MTKQQLPDVLSIDDVGRYMQDSGEGVMRKPTREIPNVLTVDQAASVIEAENKSMSDGFFARMGKGIAEAYEGDAEFPKMEEILDVNAHKLGGNSLDMTELTSRFMVEDSDAGRVSMIKEVFPEAKFMKDANGNVFTEINGTQAYINKPGMSQQDFADLIFEITKFAPGAKAAGAVTKGSGLAVKAIGQGLAEATTAIGSDALARAIGSNEPADWGDAFIAGLGAGTFEMAGPLLGKILKKVMKKEDLTRAEKGELLLAGINEKELTPEKISQIIDLRNTGTPEARRRALETISLPNNIERTGPDLRRNPEELIKLERLATTNNNTAQLISEFRNKQNEAINANVDIIAKRLSGKGEIKTVNELAKEVQESAVRVRAKYGQLAEDAYTSAKNGGAIIPNSMLKTIENRINGYLFKNAVDPKEKTGVAAVLRKIQFLRDNAAKKAGKKGLKEIPIKLSYIDQINKSINSNLDKVEDIYLRGKLSEVVDETMSDYIKGATHVGTKQSYEQLKEARGLYKQFKGTFDDAKSDILNKLTAPKKKFVTEQGYRRAFSESGIDGLRLAVDPNDAARTIFSLNEVYRKDIVPDIKDLKGKLDRESFDALRAAAFLQMTGEALDGKTISGAKFSTKLNNVLVRSPELMDVLYSQDEQDLIKRFSKVVEEMQRTREAGITVDNKSGSGAFVASFLSKIKNSFSNSVIGKSMLKIIDATPFGDASKEVQLEKYLRGISGDIIEGSSGIGAATGAAIGSEVEDMEPIQDEFNRDPFEGIRESDSGPTSSIGIPGANILDTATKDLSGADIDSIITQASNIIEEDGNLLLNIAKAESSLKPNAKAKTSSAKGLFQITDGTWKSLVKKYGKETGIGMLDRDDPKANAIMGAMLTKENRLTLSKQLGRNPSNTEIYAAHFLGPSSAVKLIRNRNSDASAPKAFPRAAKSNKSIFYDSNGKPRTIAQVYNILERKVT